MEINVTLMLQGIHFIIAWMVLKHVLLIPLFESIESRQNYIESFKAANKSYKDIILTLSQARDTYITLYCKHFVSHAPPVFMIEALCFFTQTFVSIPPIEVKEEVIEKGASHLVTALTTQLKHVRI